MKKSIIKKKVDIAGTLRSLPLNEPVVFDCDELETRPEYLRSMASRLKGCKFSISVKNCGFGQIIVTRIS